MSSPARQRRWPRDLGVIAFIAVFATIGFFALWSLRSPEPAPPTSVHPPVPLTSFDGEGDYVVGKQIVPGIYQTNGSEQDDRQCSWILYSPSGDVIDRRLSPGPTTVAITWGTFSTFNCLPWTRIGD